jgi:hypothetical protein
MNQAVKTLVIRILVLKQGQTYLMFSNNFESLRQKRN